MKSIVIVTLCVFALPLITSSNANAQPKLQVVGGTTLQLDTLYRGETVERTVTLKNIGTETLVIGEVLSSCGCTGTVMSSDKIPPGSSGSLKVTFNAKSMGGPTRKIITVRSNDPEHSATVIELKAFIVQEIEVVPQSFWFKDAEVGMSSSVSVTLRNSGRTAFKLVSVRTSVEGLTVTLPSGEVPPGGEVTVTASLKAKKKMAVISDGVYISTSSKRQPEVYIPVFGNAKEFRFE